MNAYDISIRDLQVALPNQQTLFSISNLSIPSGSHILIQGESGKGKTTFLHLIAGLFTPAKGSVHLGEINLNDLSENQRCDFRRKKIGVIFQKLNLLDHLTAQENIELSSRSEINALSLVNLEKKQNTRCSLLSLGEQQRVAVARVIAQSPELILADEPTSSLDETNSRFVMQALKDCAKGKTLIVVSHDHRIASYFDHVWSFEDIIK